jgi:hypothetical protein
MKCTEEQWWKLENLIDTSEYKQNKKIYKDDIKIQTTNLQRCFIYTKERYTYVILNDIDHKIIRG